MTTNIVNAPEAQETKTEVKIPTDIYLSYLNESEKTQRVKDNFNFLQMAQLITKVKSEVNVLHESLKKKSNVFIFGAGGTTSWFLPKLLKIYNDAFNKVPALRYDLNIILIDNDIV